MSEYKKEDLNMVQKIETDILVEFMKICSKYSLEWIVIGGTALGVARHAGFIPWDDDIDVAMPRKDYNVFIQVANNELPKGLFFQNYVTEKSYNGYFSKIRREGTSFVEEGGTKLRMHQGIFIDIFPLDNLPDGANEYKRYHNRLYRLYQIYMSKTNVGVASNQKHKRIASVARNVVRIATIFTTKEEAFNRLDKQFQLYKDVETERVGFAYLRGMTLYRKELYPIKKMKFEHIQVNMPNDYDSYLKRDYGDYMTLPPVSKRVSHSPVILDFEKEYVGEG